MQIEKEIARETLPTFLKITHDTTDKIVQIRERLKTARSLQKSYVDIRCKPFEFQIGYWVILKVYPLKGVIKFEKQGKLVAYKFKLPQELSNVHDVFHVANLKKCVLDDTLIIPIDEIQVNNKLNFAKRPIEIMDRELKRLKKIRIPIVKVR